MHQYITNKKIEHKNNSHQMESGMPVAAEVPQDRDCIPPLHSNWYAL